MGVDQPHQHQHQHQHQALRYEPYPPAIEGYYEATPLVRHHAGRGAGGFSPSHLMGLRRILVVLGLLWVCGVAYLSTLGRRILREMEGSRKVGEGERIMTATGPGAVVVEQAGRQRRMQSARYEEEAQAQQPRPATMAALTMGVGVNTPLIPSPVMGDSSTGETSTDAYAVTRRTTTTTTTTTAASAYSEPDKQLGTFSSTTQQVAENVTILVVYGPEYHSYISAFAWEVAQGVNSGFKKRAGTVSGRIIFGTTSNLTFTDVQDADAIILGAPTYNGNPHPNMMSWINYWHIESDLSKKVGAAFVTAGGIHSGAEGSLMSLLRSMMVFRMVTVGGDSWDSPFGAAATMHEDPFGDSRRSQDFSNKCYQTNSLIHPHFLRKAWNLGERVANLTFALANSTLWTVGQ